MAHIGRLVDVGIGVESSRGTGVAATFWMPKVTFTHQDRKEDAISETEYGGIWGYGPDGFVTKKFGQGELEAELAVNSFGAIMLATLGTVSTAGPDGNGAYTHTYTLQNDNSHDSLSIHVSDPIQDKLFEMSMIDSLTVSVNLTDVISYTAAFMSRPSVDSSSTPSYADDYKFTHKYFSLKVAAATGDLDAASELSVLDFSVTFEKNAELNMVLGSVQPEDIHNKRFNIRGEFTVKYENETQKDYALDGTTRALRFDLTNSDNQIGTTSPQFRLDLSKVYFDSWEHDAPLDDISTEKLSFVALYDLTNENVINSAYIINDTSSY